MPLLLIFEASEADGNLISVIEEKLQAAFSMCLLIIVMLFPPPPAGRTQLTSSLKFLSDKS